MGTPKPTLVKKQQSISSFFTPKATVNGTAKPQQSQVSPDPPPSVIESNEHGNLYDAVSDDEEIGQPPDGRLSKRILAEDTNGANTGIAERPAKRAREDDGEGNTFFASSVAQNYASTISNKPKVSPRTERYLYAPSGQVATNETIPEEEEEEENETRKVERARLHKRFVQKLGHPDSIAQIKRRNWQITEETEALDGEGEGDDAEDETPTPAKTRKKGAKTGKLTPMEIQILDIKRKHMDTLLIVEVGYKFKFYGEDARIAAKELGIVCIPGKLRFDERKYIISCQVTRLIMCRSFRSSPRPLCICEYSHPPVTRPRKKTRGGWS